MGFVYLNQNEHEEEIEVTDDLIDRVKTWFSDHAAEVPQDIRLVFSALIQSHETFKELLRKNKAQKTACSSHGPSSEVRALDSTTGFKTR